MAAPLLMELIYVGTFTKSCFSHSI